MNKTAIIILSDPDNGEEALGRVFNGLAAAYDIQQHGSEVTILFQGTGTRWIKAINQPDHPLNGLYGLVRENIAGVSSGCADFFGAAEDARTHGLELIAENAVPGTSGLPSIAGLLGTESTVLIF